MRKIILSVLLGFISLQGVPLFAQEFHEDLQAIWKARVVKVVSEEVAPLPGIELETLVQELKLEFIEGDKKGDEVLVVNDYTPFKEGDVVYVNYLKTVQGRELYSVREIDRSSGLLILATLFIGVIILFGRFQGMRSLVSLVASFVVIIFVLLPLLLKGFPPVLVSTCVGFIILFFAIFFTHGWNRESFVAFLGTSIAVCLTGLLAYLSVKGLALTGFASDESVYLNIGTQGTLDFSGLLLGGIIIGILGVLDDIAVTQVAVVAELVRSVENVSKKDIYVRALRVGREHVGALVNTLVLAYTGASLPLLLLFVQSNASTALVLNQEIFATEIVRTVIGSIGLILTVPITTFLAVYFISKENARSHEHSHGHGHIH